MTPKEQGYFDYSKRNTPVSPDDEQYMWGWENAESDEEYVLANQAEEDPYNDDYDDPDYND